VTLFFAAALATLFLVRVIDALNMGLIIVGDDFVGYMNPNTGSFTDWLASNMGARWLARVAMLAPGTGPILLAVAASLLPAIPFYWIAQRLSPAPNRLAEIGALAFVSMPPFGATTGYGFASLIAIAAGLAGLALVLSGIDREQTSMWATLRVLAGMAAVLAITPFSLAAAVPFIAILGVFGVGLFLHSRFLESSALLIGAGLAGAVAAYLTVASYDAGNIEFRPPLIVATLSAVMFGVYWYAGRYVETPMNIFIASSMIAIWALSIVTATGIDVAIVFTRAWLWLWVPVILALTDAADFLVQRLTIFTAPNYLTRGSYQLGTGALLVLFLSVGWHGSFERSAREHSTLTHSTQAAIDALAMSQAEYADAGAVAVVPHSLAWHLRARFPEMTLLAAPIDPQASTYNPLVDPLAMFAITRCPDGSALLSDRRAGLQRVFSKTGLVHDVEYLIPTNLEHEHDC